MSLAIHTVLVKQDMRVIVQHNYRYIRVMATIFLKISIYVTCTLLFIQTDSIELRLPPVLQPIKEKYVLTKTTKNNSKNNLEIVDFYSAYVFF